MYHVINYKGAVLKSFESKNKATQFKNKLKECGQLGIKVVESKEPKNVR